ncbi:hypothetical protein EMIT036CA2_20813 [Chryseobacterium sp. IT-36CA2]
MFLLTYLHNFNILNVQNNNKTQRAAEFFIDVGKRKGAKWYLKYTLFKVQRFYLR